MKNKFYDYSISAIGGAVEEEKIAEALEKLGFSQIVVEKLMNFEAYVKSLPSAPIDGLTEKCNDYIRCWGNGGGDLLTGNMLQDACTRDKSNNPQILAIALYKAIVNYTKTAFEASNLVSTIINSCLKDE